MGCLTITLTISLLLGSLKAEQETSRVFLNKQDALAMMSRHKRANSNNEENQMAPNLERECVEEVCQYEEAREIFQDTYRTDIFWSVYVDGDQCAEKPCKNGALCSDSVGSYDCICKAGFSGVHCETDQTVCVPHATKGCSQFCRPGYVSFECSCADGWKLEQKEKEKCVPAVAFPCGKVTTFRRWEHRKTLNIQSGYAGVRCGSGECPWQAWLQSDKGPFCSGVIIKRNLVLTTARCASRYSSFQVTVGKTSSDYEEGEQVLYVKMVHVHPLHVEGRPDNDLAVVELQNHIVFKKTVVAACLPERDFAESVLMAGQHGAVITGWRSTSESLEGFLSLNHLDYMPLAQCTELHPGKVTNKMFCTAPRPKVDCMFGEGSSILTVHHEVFFLTGVVSQPPEHNCHDGYIFQKISRFLPWLKPFMDAP